MLCERLGLSERRACRIAGQHRSTQRHEPKRAPDDAVLRRRLRAIAAKKPRWGYRRAHAHLLSEGFTLNRKRVQRVWREEGLRVPARKRKRRRLGESSAEGANRLRATHPGHVWALDFQHDATTDGRELKFLNVVDEFTREALAIEVERTIDADQTVATLQAIVTDRGIAPENIRADNGPELTARVLREWCQAGSTDTAYIDPGSPWQNPYAESFNARVRDELLDVEEFGSLAEAQVLAADYRDEYNERHPHSALGMMSPSRFAASWQRIEGTNRPVNPELSEAVDR
jgi:transposase InsO family protein